MDGDRVLWRIERPEEVVECVMATCCAGAELRIHRNETIVLRELYPMKTDLYERARELRIQYEAVHDDAGT